MAGKRKEKKLLVDFGCGPNKKEGFIGVDWYSFDGKVDIVANIASGEVWKHFKDNSIDEAHASHFIEHLDAQERIAFFNGLWRAMKPGAQATIITPYWASNRAYGDPTHKWPPVCEMTYCYLSQKWRAENAPHTDAKHWPYGYDCNFEGTFGYGLHPLLASRNPEFQQMALNFAKEAAQDMHATLTCRKE